MAKENNPMCCVVGCRRNYHCKGYCQHHYNLLKQWGHPTKFEQFSNCRLFIQNGYFQTYINHKQIAVHRLIMEKFLRRKLILNKEDVHHINGDKLDNRIENLKLMSHDEHVRLHQKEIYWCRVCHKKNDGHFAKGLCGKHYMQWRKGKLRPPKTWYEKEILWGRKICRGCKKWRKCDDRREYIVFCTEKEL